MSNIRVGSYVTHSQRPAWGIGKVYGQSAQHVLVGFENLPEPERLKRLQWREGLLEKSPVKGGESLDAIKVECDSTCHPIGLITKKVAGPLVAEWTFDQAFERFIQKYPSGFKDAWYIPSEREWREAAHTEWVKAFPSTDALRKMVASSPDKAAAALLHVVQSAPKKLVQPKSELGVLRDALAHPENAKPFMNALVDMLDAPILTSGLYGDYLHVLTALPLSKDGDLAKWPTVTLIPFLAQPNKHILVKPVTLRKAAKALGFDIKYTATPRWETYERVLAFSNKLFEFLHPKGAADMIDIHAFVTTIVE